ncbi:MAG: hypothetical protein H6R00_218 [Proteobacteria bacterium]|nr:hypothetical protein [Pseudomonadota bacterium]
MTELADLKAFNPTGSTITLWTFKGTIPDVNGHWIETTDRLDAELRDVFSHQLASATEQIEYGLLAENNESSVLRIPTDETDIHAIISGMTNFSSKRRIRSVKTLQNARFYVASLFKNDTIVLCVKKTDSSWTTKSSKNLISAIFSENQLDVSENEAFRIYKIFDFFIFGDSIFIHNKKNFESIANYRAAHENDFAGLQAEPEFVGIFSDTAPLVQFVGENRIHLRRISAIRIKSFYKNTDFMENLRRLYIEFGLNIIFSAEGKIVPTPETCKDIMTALLDHRLRSGFSGNTYDVPDAVAI